MNEYQALVRCLFAERFARRSPRSSNSDTRGALRTPAGRHALTLELGVRERQSPGFARAGETQKRVETDDQRQSLDKRLLAMVKTPLKAGIMQITHSLGATAPRREDQLAHLRVGLACDCICMLPAVGHWTTTNRLLSRQAVPITSTRHLPARVNCASRLQRDRRQR